MLNYSAVVLTLSVLTGTVWSQSCSNPDADVLILGGGISGIAAADRLNERGITDFLVLEALPQIGGRIRQQSFPSGVKVEVGANWIHDFVPSNPTAHPLGQVLNRCGINPQDIGTPSNTDDLTVYDVNGNEITGSNLESPFTAYGSAFSRAISNLPSADVSVRSGLTGQGWTPSNSIENWAEWFSFDFSFSQPPDQTSLYYVSNRFMDDSIPDNAGDFFITSSDGYIQVVNCIASEFLTGEDDTRIHLNTTVTRVQWSDECVCADVSENGQNRQYCAPYAIITFSIGVLQSDSRDTLFDPQLPQWKTTVIDEMFSIGNYLKIYAEFNTAFWDNSEYIGHVDDYRGYFPVFQPLNMFLGANVVLATLTGEIANQAVRLPVENVTAELVEVLRNIYGPSTPEPDNIIVPDWAINPLFLGTYSNIPVGGSDAFSELARPIGRLYFSGEATSERSSGTVHGGYLAGISSANSVIRARNSAPRLAVVNITALIACLFLIAIAFLNM